MGTFTAQMLVVAGQPYPDGIIPTHALYLSARSRPAWVSGLSLLPATTNGALGQRVGWFPIVESLLEDALLMATKWLAHRPSSPMESTSTSGVTGGGAVSWIQTPTNPDWRRRGGTVAPRNS